MTDRPRLRVIMATFNRRATTERCLRSLIAAADAAAISIDVTLADATSTDGTTSSVRAILGERGTVLLLPSTMYWAQCMRAAWESARGTSFDYLLWLNDDVVLDHDSLARLLAEHRTMLRPGVLVGAMRSHDSRVSYSGYVRGSGLNPLNMPRLNPSSYPQLCDAFNGNLVLIPAVIAETFTGFLPGYIHGLADYAYGLEARRRRIEVWLGTDTFGVCDRNDLAGTWQDVALPPRERLRRLAGPKGLPPLPWLKFNWRYGNIISLLAAIKPYAILSALSIASRDGSRDCAGQVPTEKAAE